MIPATHVSYIRVMLSQELKALVVEPHCAFVFQSVFYAESANLVSGRSVEVRNKHERPRRQKGNHRSSFYSRSARVYITAAADAKFFQFLVPLCAGGSNKPITRQNLIEEFFCFNFQADFNQTMFVAGSPTKLVECS